MKARSSEELLQKLIKRTRMNLEIAHHLATSSDQKLLRRPEPKAWNALECLAHLNFYSDYYVPEIRKRIETSKHGWEPQFKSSRLGNYFSNSMKPGPQLKKINAPKSANPQHFSEPADRSEIDDFIDFQQQTLELLEAARKVSLTKTKTGISLTNLIKLRLGDTFRVVIYHNWRHLEQALRAAGKSEELVSGGV